MFTPRLALRLLLPLVVAMAPPAAHAAESDPLIVVLTDTGRTRDGLPVFADHPQGKTIAAQLDRGFTGEFVRVYRFVQRRLNRESGSEIEPAYILLSNQQGGFARYGFYRGAVKKAGVAYIDVYKDWKLDGEFGSIDQLFPHELAHAILHQLKIEPKPTDRSNQVHAIAVRTDRFTAFNEGFAESLQPMAIDNAGAAPATRALANQQKQERHARRRLDEYRNELSARAAIATRMRMTFPLWYSGDERVLRYFAVRRNAFARQPHIAPRLLSTTDRYRAWLIENALPGDDDGEAKPVAQMIDSEGVVSALFYRWATDAALQQRYRDAAFYDTYGTTPQEVSPLQNVYLKLYSVIEEKKPRDAAALIAAYRTTFPDEAPLVDAVASSIFLGQPIAAPDEIWLASEDLRIGTTIFDQFRGLPRTHTFDLNAASMVDRTSIRGVTPELARAIRQHGPYGSIDDVSKVPGATPELLSRMRSMSAAVGRLAAVNEDALTISGMLMPFVWRLLAIVLIAGAAAATLHWLIARRFAAAPSILRLIADGIGAAFVTIIAAWWFGNGAAAIAATVVVFGFPAAAWQLLRKRSPKGATVATLRWAAAALPALIVTTPWF